MSSLKKIIQSIPSVNYIDYTTTKQAMFRLLDTNDHIVSFTKKIKIDTILLKSFRVQKTEMIYYRYELVDYASIDYISDIDSNAIEMYIAYNSDDNDYRKTTYTKIDTIITSALYALDNRPSLILGFDALYIPEHIYITMTMSLVPMNMYNKIRDDVSTETCYYNNGNVFIKNDAIVRLI